MYSQADKGEQITIPFDNNKIVVGKNWRHTDFAITPWRFFDSLAGIEFISSMDHYNALRPSIGGEHITGRSVYMRRCQYCHGIGEFGAKYAPNFFAIIPEKKADAVKEIVTKVLPPKIMAEKLRPYRSDRANLPCRRKQLGNAYAPLAGDIITPIISGI